MNLIPYVLVLLTGVMNAIHSGTNAKLNATLERPWWAGVFVCLISGAVLSFARALGEFGATLTFAGSLQGVTRTLPLEIYLQRETDPDAAIALSLLLVLLAAVLVLTTQRTGRRGLGGPA